MSDTTNDTSPYGGAPPSVSLPAATAKSVLQSAVQAAVSTATTGGSSAGTVAAFQALSDGIEQLAETTLAAASPIAGMAGEVLIPQVVPVLVNSMAALFAHIGAAVPTELTRLQNFIRDEMAKI